MSGRYVIVQMNNAEDSALNLREVRAFKSEIDPTLCHLPEARGGSVIKILQTNQDWLLKDTQADCHAACRAHPECQYYQWYNRLSKDKANRCYLLADQEEILQDQP